MRIVNTKQLSELQKSTNNIRNICILAHVDHGKTTLADSLVASNGIISQKMAGKLRYMDSRQDEQERGITMKSSSIALYYSNKSTEWLINLIDSPGHVDFSSEVSTAVCLCDGAIIVIDVVEGVCAQTRVALRQAWHEGLKPVLVLNKIDRLIIERGLSPLDAYVHLLQVLEQVNAVMGEMFASEVMAKSNMQTKVSESRPDCDLYDWSSGLEDADDSNLYFSPDSGNVLFASATDGWAFGVGEFAKVYSEKLGIKQELLQKVLWGDFYLDTKTKRFKKGAQENAKKPLFVKFVLDNIWALYDTILIRKDKEKLPGIIEKLGIKLTARDMRHTDPKVQLQAVCTQWLPLARVVLRMVCEKVPSPKDITEDRIERLMCSKSERFDTLLPQTQAHMEDLLSCDASEERPVLIFISKMFSVDKAMLPKNKLLPMTEEDIIKRRELARARHAEKMAKSTLDADVDKVTEGIAELETSKEKVEDLPELEDIFIAFARVFSGTLKKGQEVFVLGPKYDPKTVKIEDIDSQLTLRDLKGNQHVTKTTIKHLYLLMGRELEELQEAPCGNIIGIGGLEDHVLKSATISTSLFCPSFTEVQHIDPIVRVAVEPSNPNDMGSLIKGLRLLNQADACVQILLQGSGEHVLATAGEVHLERCLEDLKQRYAKIPINVSDPIVPFRETIVAPPTVDMVNENIQEQNKPSNDEQEAPNTVIEMWTANKQSCIVMTAVPLPELITNLLEKNSQLLKAINQYTNTKVLNENSSAKSESLLTERTLKAVIALKQELTKAFNESGDEWINFVDKIWSCGPRKCGANLLINNTEDYKRESYWSLIEEMGTDESSTSKQDKRNEYDGSFVNGFQLATLAGPLCEEPMQGVCFIINQWTFSEDAASNVSQPYGPVSGQIVSCVKEGCRKAFIARPQRLVAAMYSSSIMVNGEVLGKLYAVLGRRHGRILSGDMTQGSGSFDVTAVLPVVESFRFAQEIRKQTSGLASPQLMFSHWEVIDVDPYWVPSTQEEYLHFGEKADSANRSRRYMDAVRKRKGLAVEEKIVEFAEKQRTLHKKK